MLLSEIKRERGDMASCFQAKVDDLAEKAKTYCPDQLLDEAFGDINLLIYKFKKGLLKDMDFKKTEETIEAYIKNISDLVIKIDILSSG